MKKIGLYILLATSSSLTTAETYNFEADITYTSKDYFGTDIDASLLDVTYYFTPIDNSKEPLAEAAFLNKSSEISAQYGQISQEYLVNNVSLGLAGRYVTDAGVIIGLGYANKSFNERETAAITGNGTEKFVDSGYIEIGTYLTDTSAFTVSYSGNLNRTTDENGQDNIFSNTVSLRYNHLFLMSGDTSIKLNTRFGYTMYSDDEYSDDDTGILDVNGDYYFNREFSVGLGLTTYQTSYSDAVFRYTVASNYFLTDNVSIYGSYSLTNVDFNTDDGTVSDDINTFKFGLNARF